MRETWMGNAMEGEDRRRGLFMVDIKAEKLPPLLERIPGTQGEATSPSPTCTPNPHHWQQNNSRDQHNSDNKYTAFTVC